MELVPKPDRRGNGLDRRGLQRRLAEAEERLATIERQIANQRQLIAKLDADGLDAGHAKYLLAGLEPLQTARRGSRERLQEQVKSAT
jgi:multidrug resistance efflux pump